MSNCYTHFCAAIPALTEEEEAWFDAPEQVELVADLESVGIYLRAENTYAHDSCEPQRQLHITDDGGGEACLDDDDDDAKLLVTLLQRFLRAWRPKSWVGIMFANVCDKTVVDGFGGGSIFISADTVKWHFPYHFFDECEREHNAKHGISP